MSARDCSGAAEVRSCTETADSGAPDSFVTVPDTVTVAPGRATCGLTESITTEASLLAGCSRPVSAARAAGAIVSRPAPAATRAAAARARVTAARKRKPGAAR